MAVQFATRCSISNSSISAAISSSADCVSCC
jgi:hypothetical protein